MSRSAPSQSLMSSPLAMASPPSGRDLVDDLLGRTHVGALAVPRATEVVHDHLGAVVGQQQGVLPPDAPARTRDDGDAPFAELAHAFHFPLCRLPSPPFV